MRAALALSGGRERGVVPTWLVVRGVSADALLPSRCRGVAGTPCTAELAGTMTRAALDVVARAIPSLLVEGLLVVLALTPSVTLALKGVAREI